MYPPGFALPDPERLVMEMGAPDLLNGKEHHGITLDEAVARYQETYLDADSPGKVFELS